MPATDRHWTGGTGTTWGTTGNWDTAVPGSTDNAVFDGTFSNQPSVVTSTTAGGIWMTGSIGQNVTIGDGGGTLTLNGNTINGTSGLGILIDNANAFTLTINCLLKVANDQSWVNNSSNLFTVGGTVAAAGKATPTLTVDGSGSTTISGVMSGSIALTKTGTGTLLLSGMNTYSGSTTLSGGLLEVGVAEIGGKAPSGPLGKGGTIFFSGGTLEYSSSNQFDYSGRFSSAVNQAYSVDTNSQNVTWATALTSSGGSLTKLGAGTLTLSAVSTYTGTTTINAGTLKLGIASALPNTAVTVSGTGTGVTATLDLNNFNETLPSLTLGGSTSTSGASVTTGTGILTLGGNVTYDATNNPLGATISGLLALGSSTRTFTVGDSSTAAADLTVSAAISGTGGLTKAGAGTMVLSGANSYTGVTTVSAGTLQFAKQVSLYNNNTANWTATNIVVQSGATAAFNVGGAGEFTSANIDTLKALGTASGGFESGSFLGLDTTNAGGTFTYGSAIANTNSGTNVLGLTKLGTGTLVLNGASTYTGATNVNAGTLSIDNNNTTTARLAGTSSINVNSGGTLLLAQSGVTASTDRINNSAGVTISGGGTVNTAGLSEGTRPTNSGSNNGVAGMGALTLQNTSSGARATIDFGSGTGSSLVFSGLSGASAAFVSILHWTGTYGIDNSATTNDRLLFATNPNLTTTDLANWQFYDDAGTAFGTGATEIVYGNLWEIVPVPEPATYFSGILTVGALLWTQRRRLMHARPGVTDLLSADD